MFAEKPTMRYCPDCKAPNPQNRETCYVCGVRLDKPDPSIPLPGEQTYACPNCNGAIPYRVTSCGRCGWMPRQGGTAPAETTSPYSMVGRQLPLQMLLPLQSLPYGWRAAPWPAGGILITPSFMNRWTSLLGRIITTILMVALGLGISVFSKRGYHTADYPYYPYNPVLPWLYFAAVVAIVVSFFGILALLFKKEEIRVGPNWLIWRETWGTYVIERAITNGGTLRIETREHYGRNGSWWERTLTAENLAERVVVMRVTRGGSIFSLFGGRPSFAGDSAAQVGTYLAAVTGWHLLDSENGLYG